MEKFGDPTFEYHKTAAQIWGLVALRLAEAEALPFDYMAYAKQLQKYVQEIEARLDNQRDNVDLKPLRQAVALFDAAALLAQAENQRVTNSSATAESRRDFNDRLMLTERAFIDPDGLPRRPWYKHIIYAPGLYAGYAAEVLPGLVQAIKEKNWDEARSQVERISRIIGGAAIRLVGRS